MSLKRSFVPKSDVKQLFTTTTIGEVALSRKQCQFIFYIDLMSCKLLILNWFTYYRSSKQHALLYVHSFSIMTVSVVYGLLYEHALPRLFLS